MWIADGKNSSRGTFFPDAGCGSSRVFFQPLLDHALSKSIVQELGLARATQRPRRGRRSQACRGKRLEVCMNSRVFVGGIALAAGTVLCVFAARAADLPPVRAPAAVAPVAYAPPVYNWSGFYVGGNVGAGFADSSWSDPFTGAHNTFSKSGFIGGGQVGANWQINALVLGIEGDFDWTSLKGSGHDSHANLINTNTQWTSTVTGRVGAAFDRLLIYGKIGRASCRERV